MATLSPTSGLDLPDVDPFGDETRQPLDFGLLIIWAEIPPPASRRRYSARSKA
jgi:hypothetical protein